ncbi:MAG: hypothetical protein IJ523_01525 [Succinivibrionaceae bacterium]|nr:hypothetical protein [Succinivibrionaceae bacterium]
MTYSVNLEDLAEKISTHVFVEYLSKTGWICLPSRRDYLKIFQFRYADDGFYQVVVPLERSLGDYKRSLFDAIVTVAGAEKQSVEQLILYLLNPNTDILKIRLDKNGAEPGTVAIDDGIRICENARRLLAATARDIAALNRCHQGRTDDVVSRFVDSCRLGQTEIGGYVVSIFCPFGKIDHQNSFRLLNAFYEEDECASSLNRQAINRLMSSVAMIKDAIGKGVCDSDEQTENCAVSACFWLALSD